MNNRIEWIDISKGLLIALVVLGHIMPLSHFGESVADNIATSFRMWLYACHIPGFFIISGILKNRLNYINRTRDIISVIKKQKRVMSYYIIFSAIFFIRYIIQAYVGQYTAKDVLLFAYNTFTFVGMGVLWFIPAFAISEVIVYFILKGTLRIKLLYTIVLVGTLLFTFVHQQHGISDSWSFFVKLEGVFYRSIIGSSFVIIGYIMDKNKIFDSWFLLMGIASVFCFINGNVDMNNLFFHNIILYYIFAITGTMLVFAISKVLPYLWKPIGQICSYFWGATLLIMCTHAILFIIQSSEVIVERFLDNTNAVVALTFVLSMIIETVIIYVWTAISKKSSWLNAAK